MKCTRLNITYSVIKFTRFTSNPSMDHWKVINRVFKYLRYTLDYKLHSTEYLMVLEEYNDTNWIYKTNDSKSTTGYVFILNGAVVSWKSYKQTFITWSMMKSNFIALDKNTKKVMWFWNFLEDIPCWMKIMPLIYASYDNQLAIGMI